MKAPPSGSPSFRAWIYVVLYAVFIFVLSSFSWRLLIVRKAEKIHLDWLIHAVEYGFLGALLASAFGKSWKFRSSISLIAAAGLVAACYGVTDEWHQSFTPERDPSALDAMVDLAGAFFGAFVWIKKHSKELCANA